MRLAAFDRFRIRGHRTVRWTFTGRRSDQCAGPCCGRAGRATGPLSKSEAMNRFLKSLDITFRRDEKSMRPRVNKLDSRLDKTQKSRGRFYYRD